MQKIRIERTAHPKQKPADIEHLGFGRYFTDHMFLMDYEEGKGWHDPRIVRMARFPWIRRPCASTTARRSSKA